MNTQKLIHQIESANLNEKITLGGHDYILDIRFEREPLTSIDTNTRGRFSWVAHSKSNSWRAIFPMKNTTYVKFFKTLKGAKKNFIKTYIERKD